MATAESHKRPLIVIPYRDPGDRSRAAQLEAFQQQMVACGFKNDRLIVEQSAGRKFNRGCLLNVGILEAERLGYTAVILHDVDLLPQCTMAGFYSYEFFKAVHLGRLWVSKYNTSGPYKLGHNTFFGGVVASSVAVLRRANGFPNSCWGWGGEDDILRNRILKTSGPGSIVEPPAIGHYVELPHEHQGLRPETKNMRRWEDIEAHSANLTDGLSTTASVAIWPADIPSALTAPNGVVTMRTLVSFPEPAAAAVGAASGVTAAASGVTAAAPGGATPAAAAPSTC